MSIHAQTGSASELHQSVNPAQAEFDHLIQRNAAAVSRRANETRLYLKNARGVLWHSTATRFDFG